MSDTGNSIIPTDREHDEHYADRSKRRTITVDGWTIEYRRLEDGGVDEIYGVTPSVEKRMKLEDNSEAMMIDFVDTLFKADASSIYEFIEIRDHSLGADVE